MNRRKTGKTSSKEGEEKHASASSHALDGGNNHHGGSNGGGASLAVASSRLAQSTAADTSGTTTPESDDPSSPPRRITLERSTKKPSRVPFGSANRNPSYILRAPGTPYHEHDISDIPWLSLPDAPPAPKGLTRYRRLFFVCGALLGALLAWAAAQHSSMTGFRSILEEQARSFPSLDFDLFSMRLPREFADLGDNLFSAPREWLKSKDFTVGRNAYARGLRAEHPVVLLPGVISTGLESWTTDEISAGFFRKRLWGSATMMRTIVFEKERWIRHISLDPDTGLDPPGIKVRASEGFDGASHFIAGYWIWAKIIENLAVLGYDINNLWLAAYDWRLSYHNLEVRDRFFTRMKLRIEQNKRIEGKKTVLVAHSMGSSVALHFFKWVEAEGEGYGNGGPSWVEDHIEAFTSIAGTFLGVPKAMAALLSGEMRDTVELPPAAAYLLEKFFSRSERAKLFQSWAGSASMMIKGGSAIWGNASFAADDEWNSTDTHGNIYSFKLPALEHQMGAADSGKASHEQAEASHHDPSALSSAPQNLTAGDAITWLMQHTPTSFQRMLAANYSNGMEYDPNVVRENAKKEHEQTWSNPLEAPLPNAPSMKIHCLYGVGKSTERSYWYEQGPYQRDETESEGDNAQCAANDDCTVVTPLDFPTGRTGWIDASIHDEKANPVVRAGCKMGDGDGTVSLLSLGAMCVEGWKRKRYNPAGIKVITHEVKHMPAAMDPRGGLTTADHVDILGSYAANDVVLRVAAGQGSDVPENFESKIREFAARIDWDNPPASSQRDSF